MSAILEAIGHERPKSFNDMIVKLERGVKKAESQGNKEIVLSLEMAIAAAQVAHQLTLEDLLKDE